MREHEPGDLRGTTLAPPDRALQALGQREPAVETVSKITLRPFILTNTWVYEIEYRAAGKVHFALANAETGELRPLLGEAEALALARADFAVDARVVSVKRLDEAAPDSEYRGGPLPAYRVTLDHPTETHIYVSVERGLVTARRNKTWRLFDFLWMFHIMDFEEREDINNILLQILSIMGVITVMSGFVLFAGTSPLVRRKSRGASASTAS